ncbi:MAG: M23 family metallopeptidase [Blastococcus sp.]
MSAFDLELSSPFPPGTTATPLGGPGQGGHQSANWYIQYGMDLGADEGTEVRAAFDGHITVIHPHDPAADSGSVYGAQLFMRAPNDMMGGFYTHMTDVPPELAVDSWVSRGDLLGTVFAHGGIPPHLHMALVEIIGGLPGGRYQGVDLYGLFLDLTGSDAVASVTFMQDGNPPSVSV